MKRSYSVKIGKLNELVYLYKIDDEGNIVDHINNKSFKKTRIVIVKENEIIQTTSDNKTDMNQERKVENTDSCIISSDNSLNNLYCETELSIVSSIDDTHILDDTPLEEGIEHIEF